MAKTAAIKGAGMIQGETIWITGASSGMGLAMTKRLAADGNQVLATARNHDVLLALQESHEGILAFPSDVCDEQALVETARAIKDRIGYIDRVIINAGTCEYFDIRQPDWAMLRRVMEVNYFGAVNTVAQALPLLRSSRSDSPHIVAVGSLASVVPFTRAQAYGASKAALQYCFESLAVDLQGEGIAVTVVQPGFVETPLTENNDFPMPFLQNVDDAAAIIVKKMAKRPRLISFPKRLAWPLNVLHCLPGLWRRLATRSARRENTA